MSTDQKADQKISDWLEADAPRQLPDRVLRATFERTRTTRQPRGWRGLLAGFRIDRMMTALAGTAIIALIGVAGLGLLFNRSSIGALPGSPSPAPTVAATPMPTITVAPTSTPAPTDPPATFAGSWEATDDPGDMSHLTMTSVAQPNGAYELTIRDDAASVCGGAPSTMTGLAEAAEPGMIAIAQPDFTCDDGTDAHALSGPPLLEQL
ncbi:MAG: hypothetical protein ABIZ34_04475, partial [Candidatus Limnocylindrales bacterium]